MLCEQTPGCVHRYRPSTRQNLTTRESVDWNCHRRGVTSHFPGAFYTFLVNFTSPSYEGEHVIQHGSCIRLDVTTMIQNDPSDADVNNLLFYFDHHQQRCRFALRKKLVFPDQGPVTLDQVEAHIAKRQFRAVPLEYQKFPKRTKEFFDYRYAELMNRIWSLEHRGWKQDPTLLQVRTDEQGEEEMWKEAQKCWSNKK